MKAAAPGKLVLSGAYAVLDGAPAIVTAVDRYVIADTSRVAERVTPEVRAAIGDEPAPAFDASALRGKEHKLGLGSSAAILLASLAARALERGVVANDAELCREVFAPALRAHRIAQPGGSGVDVAASANGGTLVATLDGDTLAVERLELPSDLVWRVLWLGAPASTSELVGRVRAFAARDAAGFSETMSELRVAATDAVAAARSGDSAVFCGALDAERAGLGRLGERAGAPIVTPALARLAERARTEQLVVLPAGAGGGDVALVVGRHAPSAALDRLCGDLGIETLALGFGARGVHAIEPA